MPRIEGGSRDQIADHDLSGFRLARRHGGEEPLRRLGIDHRDRLGVDRDVGAVHRDHQVATGVIRRLHGSVAQRLGRSYERRGSLGHETGLARAGHAASTVESRSDPRSGVLSSAVRVEPKKAERESADEMADSHAVTVLASEVSLTPAGAAELLGLSRHFAVVAPAVSMGSSELHDRGGRNVPNTGAELVGIAGRWAMLLVVAPVSAVRLLAAAGAGTLGPPGSAHPIVRWRRPPRRSPGDDTDAGRTSQPTPGWSPARSQLQVAQWPA